MTGRSGQYTSPGRDHRTHVRITADEYAELADAASRAGLTTTGYVGEAALAAARGVTAEGETDTGGITRAELAALQRGLFAARTALTQAAADLRGTPADRGVDEAVASCAASVARLDAVVGRLARFALWTAFPPSLAVTAADVNPTPHYPSLSGDATRTTPTS